MIDDDDDGDAGHRRLQLLRVRDLLLELEWDSTLRGELFFFFFLCVGRGRGGQPMTTRPGVTQKSTQYVMYVPRAGEERVRFKDSVNIIAAVRRFMYFVLQTYKHVPRLFYTFSCFS